MKDKTGVGLANLGTVRAEGQMEFDRVILQRGLVSPEARATRAKSSANVWRTVVADLRSWLIRSN